MQSNNKIKNDILTKCDLPYINKTFNEINVFPDECVILNVLDWIRG